MNVLFLTRYDVREFGVAEVIRGLATALRPRGVQVVVASSHPSTENAQLPDVRACHHLPLPRPSELRLRSGINELIKLCRRYDIELVHCHGLYRPGYAARLLRRATGLPYVLTAHNTMSTDRTRRWRVRHRCRLILRDAAAITSFNQVMASHIHELADARDKNWIIPNGFDPADWCDDLPAPETSANVPLILGIGRVVWDKGFDMLVEAAGRMREDEKPAAWVIAGEGDMKPELEWRARELGLQVSNELPTDHWQPHTVYLPGMVRGQEKRRLYGASQLVAFPTRPEFGESFGMVLLEAMAAGRAVVASDLPIVRELIQPGRNGLVVPARDASAWAKAIRQLIDSTSQREQLEQQNRADAKQYHWSSIAERMCEVYDASMK